MGRAAQGMVTSVKGARIACLDVNLQKTKMQFGVQARSGPTWAAAGGSLVQLGRCRACAAPEGSAEPAGTARARRRCS